MSEKCLHCFIHEAIKPFTKEFDPSDFVEALTENIADIIATRGTRNEQDLAIEYTMKRMEALIEEIVAGVYKPEAKFYSRQESLQ